MCVACKQLPVRPKDGQGTAERGNFLTSRGRAALISFMRLSLVAHLGCWGVETEGRKPIRHPTPVVRLDQAGRTELAGELLFSDTLKFMHVGNYLEKEDNTPSNRSRSAYPPPSTLHRCTGYWAQNPRGCTPGSLSVSPSFSSL